MTFRTWPSINQFREVIRNVRSIAQFQGLDENGDPSMDRFASMPILQYRGTVKLHGTNSAIHINSDGTVEFQSRNNVITVEKDNAAFAFAMSAKPVADLRFGRDPNADIYIYGEWCGGNIQKGVAVSQLEKMFVVFGAVYNGEPVAQHILKEIKLPDHRIFNIYDFPTFTVDIDFSQPENIQNKLIELVEQVEAECPVGKAFGVSGIGEGLVFKPTFDIGKYKKEDSGLWFKCKGEKYSASKVKTIAAVDTDKLDNAKEFIDYVVTERRLEQGIEYLKEQNMTLEMKNTGVFLKWIFSDVMKEEHQTLADNKLGPKDVSGMISNTARTWWIKYLDTNT